ncbi:MAG: sigma-70 family RNA polymerase sigma factor [Myxococcota bacterium]
MTTVAPLRRTEAGPPWDQVAARLRPFIRRRVPTDTDADDVLQEVLLRMHRSLGDLRDDQRLSGWMHQVARTAIADHHRTRARHPLPPVGAAEAEPAPAEAPGPDPTPASLQDGEEAAAADLARVLSLFVAALPSPYREAITLTELEGLTQRDAAEQLGISLSGMKSRVQRGRHKLRGMLEACCEIALDARNRVVACSPRPSGPDPGCQCTRDS